jgi:hypothetical protein
METQPSATRVGTPVTREPLKAPGAWMRHYRVAPSLRSAPARGMRMRTTTTALVIQSVGQNAKAISQRD